MKLQKLKLEEFNDFKFVTSNLKSIVGGKLTTTGVGGSFSDVIDDCGVTTHSDGSKKNDNISI